ncbi:uncharacterized protein BP5553_07544 [Venustampulla echinocandica]|uniref:CBM1 domain-containing protein n=1 Tax=Venustampulla echinocandica TaxID=2656787 RepID=A0A370TGU1_9HELO|nr:uncharacterized protein BP5553_07544 [Venustampulla echinocandica]RDL34416.1 hypothetical protein BP5553_07544 [Venustampulla echinocandica]
MQFFKISALSALFVLAAANPIANPVAIAEPNPVAAAQSPAQTTVAPCSFGAWRCNGKRIEQCNNGWKLSAICGGNCYFTNGSPHC